MTVYIPCYFNELKDRENNFYIILNQYINLGYKIVIYWMNKDSILIKSPNIKTIKGDRVNASIARNKLLNIFYNSKEKFGIFSDDDTYLKNKIKIDLTKDCISLTNDYKKGCIETEKISSSLLLIKNFKKYYNLEPLFDGSLEANQDLDFGITLNKEGIKTYRKSTQDVIIYKGESSMFKNKLHMIYQKQKTLNYILNKK